MNKRIVYQNNQGGISIVIPTDELSLEEIIAKDVPVGVDYSIVEIEDIPSDREFRNAWEKLEGKVHINIEKAKEVKKSQLREERAPELAQLDIEFVKALETADVSKQQEIAQEKQKLRDVTKHESLLNATTVEELKGINLKTLKNV